MISLDKIRKDLKDIRYYYSRREIFDSVKSDIGLIGVRSMVKRYNQLIVDAPLCLFDIYVCLYIKGYTQEKMAVELNVSPQYVQIQNKKLLQFFQIHYDDGLQEVVV